MAIDGDENGASSKYNLRHQVATEAESSQALSPTRMFISMYLIVQRSYLTNPSYSRSFRSRVAQTLYLTVLR